MKKIAVFVEGQSEQIFVREMVQKVIGYNKVSFRCLKLYYKGKEGDVPYKYPNDSAQYHFLIIDVGNDDTVVSIIKEREQSLFKKGFHSIIGLRDMYSKEYRKRAKGKINQDIINIFIKSLNLTIKTMSKPSQINIFFAIMEFEAWILAMFQIFEKLDKRLTTDHIKKKTGIDIKNIDPQKEFLHPAVELTKILKIIDWNYDKSRKEIEKICSKMEVKDFEDIVTSKKCKNFANFYGKIFENNS